MAKSKSVGPQIEVTTSRGNKYIVTPKMLSVTESRALSDLGREYQGEQARLRARVEATIRMVRREIDAVGELDFSEYDEGMKRVDAAQRKQEEAVAAFEAHIVTRYLLADYADSIEGYDDLTDIPAWDSADLIDVVRRWSDGSDLGVNASGEALSATWRLRGSAEGESTQKR